MPNLLRVRVQEMRGERAIAWDNTSRQPFYRNVSEPVVGESGRVNLLSSSSLGNVHVCLVGSVPRGRVERQVLVGRPRRLGARSGRIGWVSTGPTIPANQAGTSSVENTQNKQQHRVEEHTHAGCMYHK